MSIPKFFQLYDEFIQNKSKLEADVLNYFEEITFIDLDCGCMNENVLVTVSFFSHLVIES